MWGAHCVQSPDIATYEEMIDQARTHALAEAFAEAGDLLVVVAGIPFGVAGATNNLRVLRLPRG
jgi:pyruvate kinase